ncbi:zinc finger AN1 domain-containing stress-associated protein 12 [Typha angustifolia]|uniref:zinc finger AN1 domain-containing stress-associated protein 12 n=1 Tax=Typha angustifolia TaxID=59011 RepID=UPI003C2D29F9
MGRGGTEAFPNLGLHCDREDCNQLDFLPFTCDGCKKVFCLEHRTYKSHDCSKSDHNNRIVVVCEICSMSIEKKAEEGEKTILEQHERSGDCDPSKKRKPTCPVRRCKELLTFSNCSTCKACRQKVCLKHRFPTDHVCKPVAAASVSKIPVKLPARSTGIDCRGKKKGNARQRSPPIEAC